MIQPCLDQHALVVVDMSRLRFVDSSGPCCPACAT
ncbi:hypothetical protein [Laribacter hongkongensis]